ncbi:MAG: YerC/YecD family TrpR-related protein [Patescibacteria group bacterium]
MEKKNSKREKWINPDTDALWEAVLQLRNVGEARRFFRDLLTEQEILEFANRWKVARMLARKVPYLEIGRRTWMSSATIARIQRWLKKGTGGYRLMLERTTKKN